jgi:hypothetical protein
MPKKIIDAGGDTMVAALRRERATAVSRGLTDRVEQIDIQLKARQASRDTRSTPPKDATAPPGNTRAGG